MLIKYCKLFFLATFVLVLSACSSGKDNTRDNSTNQEGEVMQKHNSSSEKDIVTNPDNTHEKAIGIRQFRLIRAYPIMVATIVFKGNMIKLSSQINIILCLQIIIQERMLLLNQHY